MFASGTLAVMVRVPPLQLDAKDRWGNILEVCSELSPTVFRYVMRYQND